MLAIDSVPIQPLSPSRNSTPVFSSERSPLGEGWKGMTRAISVQCPPPSLVRYSTQPWLWVATPVETRSHPSAEVTKLTPMTASSPGAGEESHRAPPSAVRMIKLGVGGPKSLPSQADTRPDPKNQSRLIEPLLGTSSTFVHCSLAEDVL